MRPSLVQVTSKPFFLPSSVMAVSARLRFVPWRFTTWCSKPDDLVKTRRDFGCAEKRREGSTRQAPVAVMLRRNLRRSERELIVLFLMRICVRRRATLYTWG